MKKTYKIIGLVVGLLLLLVVAAVVALPFLVDPNDYKDKIVQLVQEKTGRDLRIGGKIGLSFFPWLGVELNDVEFSNAKGFGPAPMAKMQQAGVKVKLLPLLRRDIQVAKVILTGAEVNLAKRADGRSNWDDLVKAPSATPQTGDAPTREETGAPPIAALSVNGLEVKDARFHWSDAQTGARYTVDKLTLTTGELRPALMTPVHLAFDFESGAPKVRSRVALDARVLLDPAKQRLEVKDLVLALGDLKLKSHVTGADLFKAARFEGELDVAPFNLRKVLEQVGVRYPTADANALQEAALQGQFRYGPEGLELPALKARLDQSQLSGNFSMRTGALKEPPHYRFDLALDTFDLDRYLSPAPATADKGAAAPAPKAPAPNGSPAAANAQLPLPVPMLRTLRADGRFRLKSFKGFGIRSTDALAELHAKDGAVKLAPLQAKLYGGSYNGDMGLDVRANVPVFSMNEKLAGVQLGPFLKDAGLFDKFSGVGNVNATVTARGNSVDEIKASLNGKGGFNVQNGALEGVDLRKMRQQIEDGVRQRNWNALLTLPPQAGDKTPFDKLQGTAKLVNGVASTDDLAVEGGGDLRVAGKGSADIAREEMDFVATLNGRLPVKVSGPFADLKFAPDWNAIAKAEGQKAIDKEKQKLEEKAREKLNDPETQRKLKEQEDKLRESFDKYFKR